jgi:uncharacterized membrane protein
LGDRLCTGYSAIDTFLPLCRGQRVGLFAGSGVGKTSLLGGLAKSTGRASSADVTVIALIGERGREVRNFVEDVVGPESMKRTVVFAATSDQPPAAKLRAARLAMATAGAAWGVYSLVGRGGGDPLAGTAANFVLAAAVAAPAMLAIALWSGSATPYINAYGAGLAILSGAVTSGLGYALWYGVLPRLAATTAATAQLCVPVIAMAGGMMFLGEPLTGTFALAAALVLGGVALSLLRP